MCALHPLTTAVSLACPALCFSPTPRHATVRHAALGAVSAVRPFSPALRSLLAGHLNEWLAVPALAKPAKAVLVRVLSALRGMAVARHRQRAAARGTDGLAPVHPGDYVALEALVRITVRHRDCVHVCACAHVWMP